MWTVDASRKPYDPRENLDKHVILQVALKHGEIYAVDFSGAQCGFVDTVMPWARYLSSDMEQQYTSREFGYTFKNIHMGMMMRGAPVLGHQIWTYNTRFAEEMQASMEHWQRHICNLTLSAMLELSQKAFETKRADLIYHILYDLRWLKDRYAMRGGLFQEMPVHLIKSKEEIARREEVEIQRMREKYGEKKFRLRDPPVIEGR